MNFLCFAARNDVLQVIIFLINCAVCFLGFTLLLIALFIIFLVIILIVCKAFKLAGDYKLGEFCDGHRLILITRLFMSDVRVIRHANKCLDRYKLLVIFVLIGREN